MNILVIGSGGREHALAWKIAQSPKCDKLYLAPGNGGTGEVATNLDINPKDHQAVIDTVLEYQIDMVVVGPEDPLVNGLVDDLKAHSKLTELLVVGPG